MILDTTEALRRRADEVYALGDRTPDEAIRQARAFEVSAGLAELGSNARASLLVDLGAAARDRQAVNEGVALFRVLRAGHPEQPTYRYNLANGLAALAGLDSTPRPAWYLATRPLRQEARELFDSVRSSDDVGLATKALTNIGNALSGAYRSSEAYDAFLAALDRDPRNGVAAGSAAQMLLWRAERGMGESRRLRRVAAYYARRAKSNSDRVARYAGPAGVAVLDRLPDEDDSFAPGAELQGASAYMRFVARHHLALVATIEGLDPHLKRWDTLRIPRLRESVDVPSSVPPLFAMLNSIKAGFLLARRLAFSAIARAPRDSGLYTDTLDYAVYGARPATLLLAQRSAMDVLDQIAVALNEYLDLEVKAKDVKFSNLWRADPKAPVWRSGLEEEIRKGNVAVIALGEVAEDIAGGYLRRKRGARHTSTHRFTVLHDEAMGSWRESPAIVHERFETFANETVETLQAVRAAILYFVEIVARHEARDAENATTVPLILPTHHWVCGEE